MIYTNRHVIQPADNTNGRVILVGVPTAKDPDELDYFKASVVFSTRDADGLDFAILKISARPDYGKFHALALAADRPELGAVRRSHWLSPGRKQPPGFVPE